MDDLVALADLAEASSASLFVVCIIRYRLLLYRVSKVVDGDTVHLKAWPWETVLGRDRAKHHVVRLEGINTPERGEKGYDEATDALKSIVDRKLVRVAWNGKGKYGRFLCTLHARGRSVNRWMVKKGYAVPYS